MPIMECPQGHTTTNIDAVRCDRCGEFVRQRFDRAAPSDGARDVARDPDPSSSLIGWGMLAGALGALVVATFGSEPLGVLLAAVLLAAGATSWLVGCIALGVRLGSRRA
jgi:hypothetical protein